MATAAFISTQDHYNNSNSPLDYAHMQSAKFENYTQEQIASPHSTDYTEADFSEVSNDMKRSNSTSSPFYEEISSFEANETGLKEIISPVKPSKMQEEEQLGSPQSTQAPSRKESDDTCSVDEEEGEGDEDESPELRDWNEKKEKMLKNLAAKCKYDWKKIAKKFNASEDTQLTPLVLKQKYKDLTKVSIPLRVKFSHEEDLQIAKYFELYGCNWTQIATHFNDRTAMMLKNRYYSHIRKKNLLSSMLEEIKETPTEPREETAEVEEEEEIEEAVQEPVKKEEVPAENKVNGAEKDNFELSYEIQLRFKFRNFPKIYFNPVYYEIENAFPNELNERITHSYY